MLGSPCESQACSDHVGILVACIFEGRIKEANSSKPAALRAGASARYGATFIMVVLILTGWAQRVCASSCAFVNIFSCICQHLLVHLTTLQSSEREVVTRESYPKTGRYLELHIKNRAASGCAHQKQGGILMFLPGTGRMTGCIIIVITRSIWHPTVFLEEEEFSSIS